MEPVGVEHPTLEQLLAGIPEQNLHGEVDWGAAEGHEAWEGCVEAFCEGKMLGGFLAALGMTGEPLYVFHLGGR